MENINIKFCKYILGVHRKSSNLAVCGELGRFPLLIRGLCHSFYNWQRIGELPTDSFIKKSYVECLLFSTNKTNTYGTNMYNLLNILKQDHIWENQNQLQTCDIKSSLETKYSYGWLEAINKPNSKLRTYSLFKTSFGLENYIISQKLKQRRQFTKLRISSHCLHIETGRYNRPPTLPESRFCTICNNSNIEDEEHFLLHCKLYCDLRANLFKHLSEIFTFNLDKNKETFLFLMNYGKGDTELAFLISAYIAECLKMRENHFDTIIAATTSTNRQNMKEKNKIKKIKIK